MRKLVPVLFLVLSTSVLSANPEPEFERQTLDDSVTIGYGIVVGDVDGDQHPDLLLADKKQYRWYENPGSSGSSWTPHVMAENLTERDNVCITARDVNGDGQVEVAVGAQWNPGNNRDPEKSGALFYLQRPDDPTEQWHPVRVKPHEPTIHRIRWAQTGANEFQLLVVPIRPRPHADGVTIYGYVLPDDPNGTWTRHIVTDDLTKTHNFDVYRTEGNQSDRVIIGGQEGLQRAKFTRGAWMIRGLEEPMTFPVGEVRTGNRYKSQDGVQRLVATIEPMHGHRVAAYDVRFSNESGSLVDGWSEVQRSVLDTSLNGGHSVEVRDLLNLGYDQVVAGWRKPNDNDRVGVKLYVPESDSYNDWSTHLIDDNRMACEYLQVADLDGDGREDIVAAGRATNNLVIYWNRTPE